MPVSLRSLVDRAGLGLRLADGAPADALDDEISWVHSSDLLDPTPWLEAGHLLLTDGSQFTEDAERTRAYVERLRDTGIVGLGFAVGVVHEAVPAALAEACLAARLPLVLVPATVPFIRIIRYAADVIAADRNRRITWSIGAQRALARATLQPDGLGATLRELEVQLGCWVALYDGLGRRIPVRTREQPPAEALGMLAEAVGEKLERGRRAASHLSGDGYDITLQTIGQRERLRGVLAVGTSVPLDPAGNDLIASVIGIASIAIEQGRALDQARQQVRRGVLALYLAGSSDAASTALRELGAWAPVGEVRVAAVAGVTQWEPTLDELELRASGEPLTFARHGDELVVIWDASPSGELALPGAVGELFDLFAERGFTVGVSSAVAVAEITEGLREAQRAVRRAVRPGQLVEFGRLADEGILAWLEAADGALPAARLLAPLRGRADASTLIESARVWFEHNCAWDPAARELEIHRHTLRARLDLFGDLCGLDLGSFRARAELWAALQLVSPV